MASADIYVYRDMLAGYPSAKDLFSPSAPFPEYPWPATSLSPRPNAIYPMVRELLRGYGLDTPNAGTARWNPLGAFIQPGMTVLLKPNMVLSRTLGGGFEALITHPSLVRAVVDFVCIALKGQGSIVIADAPMQSCDFAELLGSSGYRGMQNFYHDQGVDLRLVDLRQFRSHYLPDGNLEPLPTGGDPLGYVTVHMGDVSAHAPVRDRISRYRVTNYDPARMTHYHNAVDNSYLIARTVLSADVAISLPKIKTHRKAGVTGALKNNVGIVGHKDCLPHHCRGAKEHGSDEYLHANWFKDLVVACNEWCDVHNIQQRHFSAHIVSRIRTYLYRMVQMTQKDPFTEGSWYGNDTIWRTTLDLARILRYASKEGLLCSSPQRTVLTIADAVIAGEGEGPLIPTPRAAGILAISEDQVSLDAAMATIMGFDVQKIPTVREGYALQQLPLSSTSHSEMIMRSNVSMWDGKHCADMGLEETLQFQPCAHWAGHIERRTA